MSAAKTGRPTTEGGEIPCAMCNSKFDYQPDASARHDCPPSLTRRVGVQRRVNATRRPMPRRLPRRLVGQAAEEVIAEAVRRRDCVVGVIGPSGRHEGIDGRSGRSPVRLIRRGAAVRVAADQQIASFAADQQILAGAANQDIAAGAAGHLRPQGAGRQRGDDTHRRRHIDDSRCPDRDRRLTRGNGRRCGMVS